MNRIYLDHNATSPPSREHLQQLVETLARCLGNPSSPHAQGREASVALSNARGQVARALGVDVGDIIFVSGGTEANNLGTSGVLRQQGLAIKEQHAIFSAIEHVAVREPLEFLHNQEGLAISICPVSPTGFADVSDIIKLIQPSTTLLTLMAANNEIGTIQPVKLLGDWLHSKRWGTAKENKDTFAYFDSLLSPAVTLDHLRRMHFHVDALQAFGKIPTGEWLSDGIDSCALGGHKLGALQGVGVLFLRRGRKYVPSILGGAQEKRRRAGTENLPGIVSFGLVCADLMQEQWWENIKLLKERTLFLRRELSTLPGVIMNTPQENILPNTVNFSVTLAKKNGEDVLVELDLHGVCASSGSACSSGANLPSKILLALGRTSAEAKNAIRLSLSPKTKDEEVIQTIHFIKKILLP